jgi:putative ABC transport system substrate-binding protein
LRELGWAEGQNIAIEVRYADGKFDRLPNLVAELIGLKVDVIVAGPSPAAVAAKKATATIPIVMAGVGFPVEQGLIASLGRPGGNVSGVAFSAGLEISSKGLELLKEIAPKMRRVAVLANPANPAYPIAIRDVKDTAQSIGVQLLLLDIPTPAELNGAFATMARERVAAVLVMVDPLFVAHRERLTALAAKSRVPAVYSIREFADAGGLMSYGPSLIAQWRRAAFFVDKILRGAKPGDLPVEQPTQYEMILNLKTAKALGVTIPPSLLARADEVIQ